MRTRDTVTRLGGDEFAVLVEGATHMHDPASVAVHIVAAPRDPVALRDATVCTATSIGIATSETRDEDLEALLRHADAAIYAAKWQGKGPDARSDCAVLGVASYLHFLDKHRSRLARNSRMDGPLRNLASKGPKEIAAIRESAEAFLARLDEEEGGKGSYRRSQNPST